MAHTTCHWLNQWLAVNLKSFTEQYLKGEVQFRYCQYTFKEKIENKKYFTKSNCQKETKMIRFVCKNDNVV